jgi:cyclophilin family peptidyl-prolyl cis-trans isomerase
VKITVSVKNEGKKDLEVFEVMNDILSARLELSNGGRTAEVMKIHERYFDFMGAPQNEPLKEYHKKITLKAGAEESCEFAIIPPVAGDYKVRAAYAGGGETAWSEWKDLKVKVKDGKKELRVSMETSEGTLKLGFFPGRAMGTVLNFLSLVNKKFYDGTIFHRIIKDFMSQGGDPTGTGNGGPGYFLPQEFNDLSHAEGMLSMARSRPINSAGCQFFICADMKPKTRRFLDRQYTVFGRVVEGLDVAMKINSVEVKESKPVKTVKIVKAEIVAE